MDLTPYDQKREPRPVVRGKKVMVDLESLKADVSCAVCMEVMNTTAMTLECSHRFCKECIERWIREKGGASALCNCPTCRNKINTRRSLREDRRLDSLIGALFGPDIDALEKAEEKLRASAGPRRPPSAMERTPSEAVSIEQATAAAARAPPPLDVASNKRPKISPDAFVQPGVVGEDVLFVLRKHPLEEGPPVTRKQYIRASIRLQVRHMLLFLAQQAQERFPTRKQFEIVYFDGMGAEHPLREDESVDELLRRFSIKKRAADLVLHYKQMTST